MDAIVPDYAKSAGAVMALGANKSITSDPSGFGPIDPQIILEDGRGNRINHSVLCWSMPPKRTKLRLVARMSLAKLDRATVKMFEAVRAWARKFAETQLQRWIFHGGTGNVAKIANDFLDTKRFPAQRQIVGYEDAIDLVLLAEYLLPTDPLLADCLQLDCLQRLAVKGRRAAL